jgi:uncharacterized protein YodC (DUF2158 family)
MAEFKAGDVVRLKSGSPDMTVEQVEEAARTGKLMVWVVWFDGKKKMTDTFVPESLEISEPAGPILLQL